MYAKLFLCFCALVLTCLANLIPWLYQRGTDERVHTMTIQETTDGWKITDKDGNTATIVVVDTDNTNGQGIYVETSNGVTGLFNPADIGGAVRYAQENM